MLRNTTDKTYRRCGKYLYRHQIINAIIGIQTSLLSCIAILKILRRLKKKHFYIILSVIFLLTNLNLYGQKQKPKNESWYDDKPLHFGFSLGFNTMDFNITPSQKYYQTDSLYPEVSILNPGINIQIVTDLRPADHFDIRFLPGVSFGQRVIRFYKNRVLVNDQQRLESSFLEFPLLLKYKGDRLNNVRPYVIGGLTTDTTWPAKKNLMMPNQFI